MANIDFTPVKMDGGNEPVFVPAYVEHNKISDFISRWKCGAQRFKAREVMTPHNGEPPGKRAFAVVVLGPKLTEYFARDDMHATTISRTEIIRNL